MNLTIQSLTIGGFHCRHIGGQNKRKFVHVVCIKIEVISHRRKILLFLSTNMAAMTSHANHQYKFKSNEMVRSLGSTYFLVSV